MVTLNLDLDLNLYDDDDDDDMIECGRGHVIRQLVEAFRGSRFGFGKRRASQATRVFVYGEGRSTEFPARFI
jgi:hypothetical protein